MMLGLVGIWTAFLLNINSAAYGAPGASEATGPESISGVVANSTTNEPIPWAWVHPEPPTTGALSREDGSFRLSNVTPGAHRVTASRYGHEPATVLAEAGSDSVVIAMKKSDHWTVSTMLCGVVVDEESGKPIHYAGVQVRGTSRSTFTFDDGRFVFEGLPPKEYEVVVMMMKYSQSRFSVVLRNGEPVTLEVRLQKKETYE
jgi:hypothetical protein